MQVAEHTVVSIEYTLTDDDGQVLDTSIGRPPLAYVHGVGAIVPGLERALAGHAAGDELKLRIPADQAYGEHDPALVAVAQRRQFPAGVDLEVGMQFQADEGEARRVVTIVSVDGDEVTLDGNHPLAGLALTFDVRVVSVRQATDAEMHHGHVHGPDDDHH
jgi:FKBP-type peptidyl-prolyl cis-trans isomerase SlyD